MTKLCFYLDVMSPYTYLAWKVLCRYRSLWELDVVLKPFHLGAIMKHSGNAPPATIPGKAQFLFSDLTRSAKWYGIESVFQHMPTNFFAALPGLSSKVNRILAATNDWKLVDAAFTLIWESPKYRDSENAFVASEASFIADMFALAEMKYPNDLDALIASGKAIVMKNTQEALDFGAFGAPVFHFPELKDSRIFFGSDRWEQMAFLLAKPWLGPRASSKL